MVDMAVKYYWLFDLVVFSVFWVAAGCAAAIAALYESFQRLPHYYYPKINISIEELYTLSLILGVHGGE